MTIAAVVAISAAIGLWIIRYSQMGVALIFMKAEGMG
jgi:hypothetical protein